MSDFDVVRTVLTNYSDHGCSQDPNMNDGCAALDRLEAEYRSMSSQLTATFVLQRDRPLAESPGYGT